MLTRRELLAAGIGLAAAPTVAAGLPAVKVRADSYAQVGVSALAIGLPDGELLWKPGSGVLKLPKRGQRYLTVLWHADGRLAKVLAKTWPVTHSLVGYLPATHTRTIPFVPSNEPDRPNLIRLSDLTLHEFAAYQKGHTVDKFLALDVQDGALQACSIRWAAGWLHHESFLYMCPAHPWTAVFAAMRARPGQSVTVTQG